MPAPPAAPAVDLLDASSVPDGDRYPLPPVVAVPLSPLALELIRSRRRTARGEAS
ncbi:hypothetical protein ACIQGZ_26520 [Streptomyces sp. NPDC092296]|uniref:hypothetical protein n=1 Tax=Streptomyces sp. NPDC092296 TaxID=3366012 RepID=UPI00380DFF4A